MRTVLIEEHEHTRILRLHRPSARNAMDTALLSQLLESLAQAGDDEAVRVVVITGGLEAFSAGADLKEEMDAGGTVRRMELLGEVYAAVAGCNRPVIAAVEGHCVGGGAEVAAASDLRVAGATATFRFPGASLGVPIGSAKLIGLLGLGAAKDLVLTSRTIGAEEAYRLGLVQRLVEPGEALGTALEVAAQIASHPPEAVAYLRRQFARFSGSADRIAAENDALFALAEAGGDYAALTAE